MALSANVFQVSVSLSIRFQIARVFYDLTGSIGRNAITFRRVTVREADRHSRVNLRENVSPVLEVNLLSILPVADVGKRGVCVPVRRCCWRVRKGFTARRSRSRDLWDSRRTGQDGPRHRPMRTTVMAETKGPPDTKYGRTVCRRAVSESLHRRFVYPTSPGEEEEREEERRSRRSRRSRREEERARATESEAPS